MPRSSPLRALRPGPRAAARALVAVLAVSALVAGVRPVGAAMVPTQADPTTPVDPATPTVPEDLPPLGALPEISPALADVELTSVTYDAVAARRARIEQQREATARRRADEEAAIVAHTARDAELTEQIAAVREQAEHWEGEAARLDEEVRAVAVGSFVRGAGANLDPLFELDPDAHDLEATAAVTSDSLARRQIRELERARDRARRARSEEELSLAIRDGVRDALAAARVARDEARADEVRLDAELVEATVAIEDERRLATVVGTDLPLVVLDAYWKAAALMRLLAPGCGISWWALAGIGKIESGHGTYGGAEVRADGSLTKPIIGIPLTGSGGTAAIGDSDGGLIDGDPTVDRAAGPMQFIPQTWVAHGVDGDQDGEVRIQDLDDAAASAAAYLCAAAGSMVDVAGLQRGYFSYNHSGDYVASVLGQAIRYGNAVEIEGVPLPPAPPPPPPAPVAAPPG